jgi:hypothetical protein
MPDAVRIEVGGLRDLLGRFAHDADSGLQERQDHLLERIAQQTRSALSGAAPRGPGSGPHLADLFVVSQVQREGSGAQVSVSNTKEVTSKSGRVWSLLDLISGGTAPHPIVGNPILAFSVDGAQVFARSVQHPGTPPNPFVQETLSRMDIRGELMRTARGVLVDLAGSGE